MSIWNRNPYEATANTIESLSDAPSGGPLKMWLAGVGVALIPIGYGLHCLLTGHAVLPGQKGSNLDTHGRTAVALAIAYLSIGAFLHFHYFWGLHRRLCVLSPILKALAALVFLGSFGWAIYHILL